MTDLRSYHDDRLAIESWLSRSLAAAYVTLPGEATPRELLDLLPIE